MSERKMKRVADSMTEQSHLLMPKCLNAAGYLFGGQLLAWIDETAGIDAKRLRMEDRSTTTRENLKFCNELQSLHTERVGILSNDFHIYRAVQMARRQGYEDVCGIPSASDALMQPHYVLREVFAVLAATARGKMRI